MNAHFRCIPAFVLIIVALCAVPGEASPSGWDTKATTNERAASRKVGGFSESQRVAYHQGLQHLYNTHQRVGGYTIRQVVAQERTREAYRAKLRAARPAPSEQPEASGPSNLGVAVLVLILLGIVVAALRSRTNSISLQPFDDTPYRLNALTPIRPANIIAIKGKVFYWEVTAVALGPINNRRYVRGTPGMSFRVARGVSVRSPGTRGHYVNDVRIGVLDHGRLLFSNVRMLFIGSSGETAFVGFQRILSIEPLMDGFRVVVDKGHPQTYRTGSQREAVILRRLVAGDIGDHNLTVPARQDATAPSGPAVLEGKGATDDPQRLLDRINRDRVSIAQQRASGALSEADYAKAMHDLDALAARATEWTT
jgi:hypothetical protein